MRGRCVCGRCVCVCGYVRVCGYKYLDARDSTAVRFDHASPIPVLPYHLHVHPLVTARSCAVDGVVTGMTVIVIVIVVVVVVVCIDAVVLIVVIIILVFVLVVLLVLVVLGN